jgi:hypothetical protein
MPSNLLAVHALEFIRKRDALAKFLVRQNGMSTGSIHRKQDAWA